MSAGSLVLFALFLSLDIIFCDHARSSWTHPTPPFRWSTSETKRWNIGVTLRPPPLNTTRNLSPCHFTTLPPFPPCHLTTLSPFQTCHSLPSNFSDLAISLSSHLSHLASLLTSHLSHPPNSLPSALFQLTTLLATNRSFQNNILPLGRQGKHVWLIVRQPLMKAG